MSRKTIRKTVNRKSADRRKTIVAELNAAAASRNSGAPTTISVAEGTQTSSQEDEQLTASAIRFHIPSKLLDEAEIAELGVLEESEAAFDYDYDVTEKVSKKVSKKFVDDKEPLDEDVGYPEEVFEHPEDTYTLLFVSEIFSMAFAFGLFIFLVQIAIMALIMDDLIEKLRFVPEQNNFNIPADVDIQVVISQALALVVALVSQDDALISIDALFAVKYNPNIQEVLPYATWGKWVFCHALRWMEGIFSLFISFTIVAQSDNVLDIFMNFAALEFISELDNVSFSLAQGGYIGLRIRDKTRLFRHLVPFQRVRSFWRMRLTEGVFCLNLAGLLLGWGGVHYRQKNGVYLQGEACNSVMVSMGQGYFFPLRSRAAYTSDYPGLFMYSAFVGRYLTEFDGNQRPTYIQEEFKDIDHTYAGKFYYCDATRSWHFTVPRLQHLIPEVSMIDACAEGWLMQSPETEANVLEDVPTEGWKVYHGNQLETADDLSFRCGECRRSSDCSLMGTCREDGTCECNDGWQGYTCNTPAPFCPNLTWVHYGNDAFEYFETGPYVMQRDDAGEPLFVYRKPVYRSESSSIVYKYKSMCLDDSTELFSGGATPPAEEWSLSQDTSAFFPGCFNYVLYNGGYWMKKIVCGEEGRNVDFTNYHAFWNASLLGVSDYFTDPTDIETPDLQARIQWHHRPASESMGSFGYFRYTYPSQARFECTNARACIDGDLPVCGRHGTCQLREDGDYSCACHNRNGGYFCEKEETDPYTKDLWGKIRKVLSLGDYENYCDFHDIFTSAMEAYKAEKTFPPHFLQFYYKYLEQQVADEFFGGGDKPYTGSLHGKVAADALNGAICL